jgi:hypothetical protein
MPASSHGRQTRLLELTMQACTDGAGIEERTALGRADRYVIAVGERLGFSELRMMSLRLLVAAEVGRRMSTRLSNPLNARIAEAFVRGARAEILELHPDIGEALLVLPVALVDLAWMQRDDSVEGPASIESQMEMLRAQFGDQVSEDALRVIESVLRESHESDGQRKAA